MTNQSTMDKLLEMRLPSMADAFRAQMSDLRMKDVSFEDRFGMLVDIEYNSRRTNGLKLQPLLLVSCFSYMLSPQWLLLFYLLFYLDALD